MKRNRITPQLNTTYYQKRGVHAWGTEFNNNPELKEKALKDIRNSGLYTFVDFYPVGKSIVLQKMELTQKGVDYYNGAYGEHGVPPTSWFPAHWSTEPEKY